ncbi:hypothetical protein ACFLTL_02265 [Chloroflexota bacterium]
MSRRWFLLPLILMVVVTGLSTGCGSTLPEEQPWAGFAAKIALKLNIAEDKMLDAFEQAFEDGAGMPGGQTERRIPELTEEDVELIFEWYQNHPEGVTIAGLHAIRYFNAEVHLLSEGSHNLLDSLAVRVAEILGLDRQIVMNAFHLVNREDQNERHRDGLDNLITEGALSQEQADRYFQWYLTRPDSVGPGRMSAVK